MSGAKKWPAVFHVDCGGATKRFGLTSSGSQRYRCKRCSQTFVSAPRFQDGERLSLSQRTLICSLLQSGFSIREVAERTGHHHVTVTKHRRRLSDLRCGCGSSAGHRGWCDARLSRRPIRQAYYDLMRRGGNRALVMDSPVRMAIDRIVPKALPLDIREEVLQDVTVLILSKQATFQDATAWVSRLVKDAWKNSPENRRGARSIDAPIDDGDGVLTLGDMLSDNGEQARRVYVDAEM